MISAVRKRVLFLIVLFLLLFIIIRYLISSELLLLGENAYQTRNSKVPVVVTVYYEALCPDSKHFIDKQLIPAYKKASPVMDVILIPYGKAQTHTNDDGSYRFDCQHGPAECQANMYHACVVDVVEENSKRLEMIDCMIKYNRLPKEAFEKCAKQLDVESINRVQKCYDGTRGGQLLKLHGEATNALRPSVTFIPTVTLDGSQGNQAAILKDLLSEVCKILRYHTTADAYCT